MEIRILGPLEVSHDGRLVELGAGRQRALLALLALHARETVATDHLIEELWGGSPPPTASKALQNLVSTLRRSLGADSIATRPPGYSLRLEADDLDASRFERLAAEGHRLLEEDPARAGRVLREALGLWRGLALADFAYEDFAQTEIARLGELRLAAIEDRIDADLALGRATELVPELESLVSAHPLRERLRGQFMLALYRTGRQADALEAYRSGRRLLDAELGLEPKEELQRLERAILNHDPALELPPAAEHGHPTVAQPRRAAPERRVLVPPDSVAVIDLERLAVVGHVPVGRRPVAVAIGHGSIWVANADDGTVSRIDADRREVIRTIGIGAPAIDLAVGTDAVWVANGSDGTVSRIDPGAEVVVETIDLRGSNQLVWNPAYAVDVDDDSVWIATGPHHVHRFDPRTHEPSAVIDVGRVPVDVAVGAEAVWVVTTGERALRIEPHTNAASTVVPIGWPPVAVTAGNHAVWVSDERGQVWRINPDTATVTQTTPLHGGLMGLCATDEAVFATNNAEGTVVRIDPQDGRVVGVVPVGHAPTGVASVDGMAWVAVQSESDM